MTTASKDLDGRSAPLDGIRVLDLTSVLMGPYATQILGELGADVIKVESPKGDTSRGVGARRNPGMAANFLHINRYKRGMVLNLKHPDGRGALLDLVRGADVLIYNIRPAAMARLELAYEDVAKINPRIIYAGVYGYGQDGPYGALPAYDDLIQGAVGLPDLIAQVGDGTPRYVPLVFVDRTVGLAAANAICAALLRRERTGQGQSLDIPMFETMLPFVLGEHMGGASFDPPAGNFGYTRLLTPERRPYRTADGYICAVIYTDQHWRDFYRITGREAEFDQDERVANMTSRTENMHALCTDNARHFLTAATQTWFERLRACDIPCMVLNTLESLLDDPHLRAVDYFEIHEHPTEGAIRQMRPATIWSTPFAASTQLAPRLGEHTREILAQAGFDDARIDSLMNSGAAA